MTERCSKQVWRDGAYTVDSCSRKAVVVRDDKGYCKQHDPVEVGKKRAERFAKWDRASAIRQFDWARTRLASEAYSQVLEGAVSAELAERIRAHEASKPEGA
jgi:hypothetical protein